MDGDEGDKVVGRIQFDKVRCALDKAEKERQGVADDHPLENSLGSDSYE